MQLFKVIVDCVNNGIQLFVSISGFILVDGLSFHEFDDMVMLIRVRFIEFHGDVEPVYLAVELQGGFFFRGCLLYTSPSPRDLSTSRMPSSA